MTFSAGSELRRRWTGSRARIVGEAAGGSHSYGDMWEVELENFGWTVHVPPQYVTVLRGTDERVALKPDVPVQITAAAYFAGRDPVLQRAISLR